jgi:iron complex transport system permease protein
MAGVAVGYALSALTSFLVFASDSAESSRSVMFWLLGSLGLASWSGPLVAVAVTVVLGTGILMLLGPRLDTLQFGDDTALTLGIITALVGAPFLLLLVHRMHREAS